MTAAAPVWTVPRPTWTWRASLQLELRALGWMLGVTLPVVSALLCAVVVAVPGSGWGPETVDGSLGGVAGIVLSGFVTTVSWAVVMTGASVVPTVLGALAAVPFTMLLGVLMRSVRCRGCHVAATAVLAGTLAALPCVVSPDLIVFLIPVSLAAGAAGALARVGAFRASGRP